MAVLSVDGGGVRGVIPARICEVIERETGAKICELFKGFAGTSTGTLVLSGLLCPSTPDAKTPRFTASQMVSEFQTRAQEIFHASLREEIVTGNGYVYNKYDPTGLENTLNYFAGDILLKDLLGDVLFTTTVVPNAQTQPFLYRITKGDGWEKMRVADVLRATTAAPTYFPAAQFTINNVNNFYLDGGLIENNPSYSGAIRCAKRLNCGYDVKVLSLSTGEGIVHLTNSVIENGGGVNWVHPLFDTLFLGQDEVGADHTKLFVSKPENFLRTNLVLPDSIYTLDDASKIPELIAAADAWVADHHNELQKFYDSLKPKGLWRFWPF